jgi:Protein-disulfide isomerase
LIACLIALFASAAVAQTRPLEVTQGFDYVIVPNPQPPRTHGKIRVQEFFWYACPHCLHIDPLVQVWRKKLPADVAFQYVPDSLGRGVGIVHQRAYYIARMLHIEHVIHDPLFHALAEEEKPIITMHAIEKFFVDTAGITPAQFEQAAESEQVAKGVRRADQLAQDYHVIGTPTFVVGGQYATYIGLPGYSEAGASEKSLDQRLLRVVDALIDKVRAQH